MRNYEKLPTIEEFGAHLLTTGDLDPLYIVLYQTRLENIKRWLFAYWCCYHAGTSCWISEQPNFWNTMRIMAANDRSSPLGHRWPRGHERRHFRGDKAIQAVKKYSAQEPEAIIDWIIKGGPKFQNIRDRVMSLPQMGPWMAFKIGDMLERVIGVPIDFSHSDVFMFEAPYESALQLYQNYEHKPSDHVKFVSQTLIEYFQSHLAPPRYNRAVNIQEIETILCKWKSHQTGSYPLDLDTTELKHGLQEWSSVSETAKQMMSKWPFPLLNTN